MPVSSACPMPASRPSSPPSRRPSRRSPTIPSPRCIRNSASCASATPSFVLADIPGLIEGAHEGDGLGDRFLGHVERCAVLLHLVDVTGEDPVAAYRVIRDELEAYRPELAEKPEIVALNKIDLRRRRRSRRSSRTSSGGSGKTPMLISGATAKGVPEAMKKLLEVIDTIARAAARPPTSRGVTTEEMAAVKSRPREGPPHRRQDRLGPACRRQDGDDQGAWLDSLIDDLAALRGCAAPRSSSSRPAPSRSAAARSAFPGRPEARGEAGRRRRRPDRAGPRLVGGAAAHGMVAAQVLVTLTDTEERRRYLNARATLSTLLEQGAVPVINENDTVATSRNPLRRQRPAGGARRLHDVGRLPGAALRRRRPLHRPARHAPGATFLPRGRRRSRPRSRPWRASPSGLWVPAAWSPRSRPGKIALGAGCNMVIASGHELHPLQRILEGARCTWFVANASRPASRASAGSPARLQPIGHLDRRRRRGAGAGQGQEPAAGRRQDGRRQLRARRCRVDQ